MYTHSKRSRTHACQRSCSPCQNSVDYGNIKIIPACTKKCQSFIQSVEVGHCTEEEEKRENVN